MQVSSLQSILNTNTFKDFHTPNSAVCSTLGVHSHLNNIENKAADVVRAEKSSRKNGIKKILPLAGAVIGTLLPLVILNNFKGKSLNMKILKDAALLEKLKEIGEYFEIEGAKEILLTAGGAIAGGLSGGVIFDKNKENRKEKVKEAVFEMTNIAVPTLIAAGTLDLLKSKKLDKGLFKFAPFVLGLGAGIPLASKVSGFISKKIFKEDKDGIRKFHPKDFLVHADDMVEMLVLLKIPFAKQLHIDKLLALIYAKCGYETGIKDTDNKGHGHHH